jgi:hypothetical protein
MPTVSAQLAATCCLVFVVGVTACAPQPTVTECPGPPAAADIGLMEDMGFEAVEAETRAWAQGLVGMTEQLAESCAAEAGFTWRVIARNGEDFAVTADYSPTRINARIDRGLVSAVSAG